ncbi:MAG TPA: ATP-binding protein [Thermoanaerobaculia bacterium]|nr:ATP-binding protein [Thermoanaerobaculia bacterium]
MASELPVYEKLGAFYLGRPWDPDSGKVGAEPLLYDSQDLLTHAVCVGMTGSGKTGLCVGLLEEAALDGIPALIIDPKGDLGNLMLTFPELRPQDFLPWVDEGEAKRSGLSLEEYAARQAELWKTGLTQWDEDGERIRRLRAAADVAIYTPGSEAGIPVSILGSLKAPGEAVLGDAELFGDRVQTLAGSILTLMGIDADPVRSREHVLLSTILADRWRAGVDLDLASLIHLIQEPPVARVGVMDLETFFPAKDRFALAIALNNLLAAPAMQSWLSGEPLDIDRLLYSSNGKPRLAVLSIAHLGDAERMFFTALLLNEVVGWMRSRSGTSSLRAVLYMDEIFGFLPPVAEPPSKRPMLTLLKQARAFGLGVVLATQNPADIDYKALANAGTWFLGRLQTEQDKNRVLEGLKGAATAAGGSLDVARMAEILSGLGKRVFLVHNVHENEPLLMQTRWALSYLRGPLTRQQIKILMDPLRAAITGGGTSASSAGPGARASARPAAAASAKPLLPPDVPELALAARGAGAEEIDYQPCLLGLATVHFADSKRRVSATREVALLLPLAEGVTGVDWRQAEPLAESFDPERDLEREPLAGASFGDVPSAATEARSYKGWERDFGDAVFRDQTLELYAHSELGLFSQPGESERDFRIRLGDQAREQRDFEKEKLRQKYQARLQSLEEKMRRAQERIEREAQQASAQRTQTLISIGQTALSVLFGRKTLSRSTIGRAASAVKGVSRSMDQGRDVDRAEEGMAALQQQHADLAAELERELAELSARYDATTAPLETVEIRPRKSDVEVRQVTLAWAPWRRRPAGGREPAWT